MQNLYKIHITVDCQKRAEYFNKCAIYTEYLFKIMMFFYISGVFFLIPYPVYMYFIKHEVITIIPLYFPFFDETTLSGYIIISSMHLSFISTATLGLLACDFFFTLLIVSSLIFAKLISFDIQQLNHELQINKSKSNIVIKYRLQNIFLMHQQNYE